MLGSLLFFPQLPSTSSPNQRRNCTNDSVIVSTLLNSSSYNKNRLPGGGSVFVEVDIWVQEVTAIYEISSEFELDLYVTEQWMDRALAYDHMIPCKTNISLDGGSLLPTIWSPKACFVNSKNATIHRSPFTNIFLMIYSNGTVWVNYRIKLTGPCEKDLRTFPIDQQSCFLIYESFNHNFDEVQMWWSMQRPPILLLKKIILPDYHLVNFSSMEIRRVRNSIVTVPSANWSS